MRDGITAGNSFCTFIFWKTTSFVVTDESSFNLEPRIHFTFRITKKLSGYDILLDKANGCAEIEIERLADNFPLKSENHKLSLGLNLINGKFNQSQT